MSFQPALQPDYGLAARALVRTLRAQADVPARAQALLKFNRDLSDPWFPMYLKVLTVIGTGAPAHDQALVADAVAHGLQHGQTAGGTLGSWGLPSAGLAPGQGFLRMSAARVLDPIAYLVVWYSQSTARQPLPAELFEQSLAALIQLLDSSATARTIYQAKLQADVAASAEGAYNSTSLLRLRVLVDAWLAAVGGAGGSGGPDPRSIAKAVAQAELRPPRSGLGFANRVLMRPV